MPRVRRPLLHMKTVRATSGHRAAEPKKNWHVPRHWFRPRRSAVRLLSSDATKVAPRAVTQPSSIPGAPIEACTAKRERLETVSQACRLGRARAGGAGLVPDWDSFPGRSVDTVVVRVLHRPFRPALSKAASYPCGAARAVAASSASACCPRCCPGEGSDRVTATSDVTGLSGGASMGHSWSDARKQAPFAGAISRGGAAIVGAI